MPSHIARRKPPPNAARPRTPSEIARRCLAEAHGDPAKATTLVGRYARGAIRRAAVAAIGTEVIAGTRKGGRA